MPLKGIKVIEIVGLAPSPFCGLILSDFGAQVIRVDRPFRPQPDCLTRGKKSVYIDLKQTKGQEVMKHLCDSSDVLIEPFRAGVMERLNLGPNILMSSNEKLIYARLSGYGQTGVLANKAGHDINYLAISGILSRLTSNSAPNPPINILGDFAGGGLVCALGICLALIERSKSGKGQIIDANIVEGASYVSSWIWQSMKPDNVLSDMIWPNQSQAGKNTLDGGSPFYKCYQTKDNKYMAVGAIEPQFWQQFINVIGIDDQKYNRYDITQWAVITQKIQQIFSSKTQEEWVSIFDCVDACVTPVLDLEAAQRYQHNVTRNSFLSDGSPTPAPVLSRTPANTKFDEQNVHLHTKQVLLEHGYTIDYIRDLENESVIQSLNKSNL